MTTGCQKIAVEIQAVQPLTQAIFSYTRCTAKQAVVHHKRG
jgi:hypothetical protein